MFLRQYFVRVLPPDLMYDLKDFILALFEAFKAFLEFKSIIFQIFYFNINTTKYIFC